MAMRLARPKRLIDIARIPELAFVRQDYKSVVIGATTHQCVLETRGDRARGGALARRGHAVHRSCRNPFTRNMGGSLANADPSAEIGPVAVTLRATLLIETSRQAPNWRPPISSSGQ